MVFVGNNCQRSCQNASNNRHNYAAMTLKMWTTLSLISFGLWSAQGAAVYSITDIQSHANLEPLCSAQQEYFIESDGKESSLILEFNSKTLTEKKKSCTRILSAPSNYGFIVRLLLPKIRHGHHNAVAATVVEKPSLISAATALNEMTSLIEKLNSTALKTALGRTCPLSIFSSHDPHTPQWRVDPCQLEDTAPEMEDPVRLFHGRVRIVWEHGENNLHSKLMVTVLGKGEQCKSEKKHQCLKIGDEPILCISKDLVCDGIRHCPYSNEYDSDEDYSMCWKRRRFGEPIPPAMESDIFEHFALEVFRNLFAFDAPTGPESEESISSSSTSDRPTTPAIMSVAGNSTTLRKVDSKKMKFNGLEEENKTKTDDFANHTLHSKDKETGHHRRNSTRSGLSSDLSKYGPWGYLMLGMLLCGGALLICGLWASASQHAANNERESALQHAGIHNGNSMDHTSGTTAPPNYEELEPPPAYSVLFPNQKAASNTTLSSLEAPSTAPTLSPSVSAATSGLTNAAVISAASALTTVASCSIPAVTIQTATPPNHPPHVAN